jgi:hypothetical protein
MVQKFIQTEESSHKFTDVDMNMFTESEWDKLNSILSMKYLALRVVPTDNTQWVDNEAEFCQTVDTDKLMGAVPALGAVDLTLNASHGKILTAALCNYRITFVFGFTADRTLTDEDSSLDSGVDKDLEDDLEDTVQGEVA